MSADAHRTESLLRAGRDRQRAGDLDAAKSLYLELLSAAPGHGQALHFLADIDLVQGRARDAEALMRRALEADADGVGYYNTLGNVLFALGRLDESEGAFREELRRRPDFAVAHNQLGQLLKQRGDLDGAIDAFRKAVRFAPDFAAASNNLGKALNNARRLDEARAAFEHAVRLAPGSAEAYNNLGHVQRALGNTEQARTAFTQAIEIDPEYAVAQRNLGILLAQLGQTSAAVGHLREALNHDRADFQANYNLGVLLADNGLLEQAEECFARAIAARPEVADTYCNLGATLVPRGDLAAAEEAYRDALRRETGHVQARVGLAAVLNLAGRGDEVDAVLGEVGPDAPAELVVARAAALQAAGDSAAALALVRAALEHDTRAPGAAPTERTMQLSFTAGELLDKAGDYPAAFEQFHRANTLKGVRYDRDRQRGFTAAVIATYSAAGIRQLARSENPSEQPVFIVGMPRSGTSLVEQILASHAEVCGAGELDVIQRIAHGLRGADGARFPQTAARLTTEQLDGLAGRYLEQLIGRGGDAKRVVDKAWHNFEYLGLIQQLLPRARVIHCRRDPLDTGLSCYFHNFYGQVGLPFSYDLADIGAYTKQYRRLMHHWEQVLPLPLHAVDYEALVADLEKESRALIEFLGLSWDPACLAFHRSERVVTTASFAEVRQPLYARSVARHQHYEAFLEPLRGALED